MTPHFLTYFDHRYAACGIAMLRSLRRFHPVAPITVLCFDERAGVAVATEFGDTVERISPDDLTTFEPELARACTGRSPWEAYATHKPIFMRWALGRVSHGSWAVFVDADLYFFADPLPLWHELTDASIGISPHRFPQQRTSLACYGHFNAGFVAMRHDAVGLNCASEWSNACIAWCGNQAMPDGRYMNQGYLNAWPHRYSGVHAWGHPGHNVGPWNLATHTWDWTQDGVSVDGRPLIFYHFSGLHCGASGFWQTAYDDVRLMDLVKSHVYEPYLHEVNAIAGTLFRRHGFHGVGSVRAAGGGRSAVDLAVPNPAVIVVPSRNRLVGRLKKWIRQLSRL